MKKRTFSIIKCTPHKNNKNGFWLLVSKAGQVFSIQTPDWGEDIEIDIEGETVTLYGDIERVATEYTNTETKRIRTGTKLCPKLDF